MIDSIDFITAVQQAILDVIKARTNRKPIITTKVYGSSAAIEFNDFYITLYLPESCKGNLTREQADVFTGYWLHEVLHYLYSDMDLVARAQRHPNPMAFALLNGIEDARIEKCAIRDGIATNLVPVLTRLRQFTMKTTVMTDEMGWLPVAAKLTINLDSGIDANKNLDLPRLNGLLKLSLDESRKPDFMNSDGAYQLMLLLLETEQDDGEQGEQGEQGDDGQDDGEQGDDGESGEQGDDGESGEQGDDGQDDGESGEQGDESGDDGQDDGESGDDGQDDGEQGDGQGDDGEQGDDGQDDGEQGERQSGDGAGDGDGEIHDASDSLDNLFEDGEKIDHQPEDWLASDHPASTLSRETQHTTATANYYLVNKIKALTNGARRLEQALKLCVKSPAFTGVKRYEMRGKLDKKSLARAVSGAQNVHAKRWFKAGENTAMVVCSDISVSMDGSLARCCAAFTMIAAKVFKRAAIPFAIIKFDDESYCIKGFGERLNDKELEQRTALIAQPNGGTDIQRAIMTATKLHDGNPAPVTRKVIVVVTDGDCRTGTDGVNEAIRYAKSHGVTVFGIGIEMHLDANYDACEHDVTTDNLASRGLKMLAMN